MLMPYAVITTINPFLKFNVSGIDFTTLPNVGTTYISVYRVFNGMPCYPPYGTPADEISVFPDTPPNDPQGAIHYSPLQYVSGNNFTFVMDSQIFSQGGGRYKADLYYLGTYIMSIEFIYSQVPLEATNTNV